MARPSNTDSVIRVPFGVRSSTWGAKWSQWLHYGRGMDIWKCSDPCISRYFFSVITWNIFKFFREISISAHKGRIGYFNTAKCVQRPYLWTYALLCLIFSLPLLPKAKRSVGNKESGLEKIVVDMLRSKIKLQWRQNLHLCNINRSHVLNRWIVPAIPLYLNKKSNDSK